MPWQGVTYEHTNEGNRSIQQLGSGRARHAGGAGGPRAVAPFGPAGVQRAPRSAGDATGRIAPGAASAPDDVDVSGEPIVNDGTRNDTNPGSPAVGDRGSWQAHRG